MTGQIFTPELILAEDVRQEVGGKFTLIGVIPKAIRFNIAEGAAKLKFGLATYAELHNISKTSKTTISVKSPDGNTIATDEIPTPAEVPNNFLVIAGKISSIPCDGPGTYRIELKVDDQIFVKDLEVIFSSSEKAPSKPRARKSAKAKQQ